MLRGSLRARTVSDVFGTGRVHCQHLKKTNVLRHCLKIWQKTLYKSLAAWYIIPLKVYVHYSFYCYGSYIYTTSLDQRAPGY